jgi:uncharacterized membrane protein YdbT with pleckstrin-like domain
MSYLERNLAPNETLAYLGRLHWGTFISPIFAMLVAAAALVVFALEVHNAAVYVPVAGLLAALIWGFARYLAYITTEFGVTSQRVVMKKGLIGIATREIMLSRIEAIQVLQSIGGRIFGYGDVIVTGTGGTNEVFAMISRPADFRAQVQSQLAGPHGRTDATTAPGPIP